jgi:hypothetical protein
MITKFKLFLFESKIDIYPTEVFHGTNKEHDFSKTGKEFNGTFFSTDKKFVKDYTGWWISDKENEGIIYKVTLKPNLRIYDTTTLENCTELIDKFGPLEDDANLYGEDEDYMIDTPDKLYSINQDNWFALEFKKELIEWVSQSYDGIILFENRVKNILLFNPVNEKILSYEIIEK